MPKKGKGIVSDFTGLVKKVVYGTNELPPNVKRVLGEVGDAVITGADIGRTPVQSVITGIIKLVASTPYEKLFHLFIILHTTKGDVKLEKNERINMERKGMPSGAESIKVPSIPSGLTVQQLVDNTASLLGRDFIRYSAKGANCQDFQIGILNSNKMNTPELQTFVKQDTKEIFKSPWFRKFANTVTDVAGRANILYQGGKIKRFRNNELDNTEIDELIGHYRIQPYNGCHIVNELPPRLRNGFYVLNLNGQSHWVGLLKNGSKYYYFDSFGFGAPTVLEKKMSKDYVWNDEDIQHIDSSSCGWYVVCWMRTMMHDPTERGYRSFMKLFYKRNNEENEAVLGGLLC